MAANCSNALCLVKTVRYLVVDLVEGRKALEFGTFQNRRTKRTRNRTEWLQQITQSRDVDRHFKDLVEKDRVYTCEKHFKPEDIELDK